MMLMRNLAVELGPHRITVTIGATTVAGESESHIDAEDTVGDDAAQAAAYSAAYPTNQTKT